MTRESILKEIKQRTEVHTIKILGNDKDKSDAFYILMNTQEIFSDGLNIYHGIKNETLEWLKKAEIDFKILSGGETK